MKTNFFVSHFLFFIMDTNFSIAKEFESKIVLRNYKTKKWYIIDFKTNSIIELGEEELRALFDHLKKEF